MVRPAHRHFRSSLGLVSTKSLRAFTLLELLVSVSIIVLLVGILGSALIKVRESGRDLVCKTKKKTVASEFFLFADDYAHPDRGDSEDLNGKFHLEDFVERMYGLDEFWKKKATPGLAYNASDHPLMCPSGPQELSRTPERANGKRFPCGEDAFDDWSNISTAFNQRLNVKHRPGAPSHISMRIELSNKIMKTGMAPLAFDVDGKAAVDTSSKKREGSLYGTPEVDDKDPKFYQGHWYPATPHLKRMNVAFIGGHVLSSSDPEHDKGWRWKYSPR